MVYYLSDLILEWFGWVWCGSLEVVFVKKILYFGFLLVNGEYDYRVSFVSCCYHVIIVSKFCLNWFHCSGFVMCNVMGFEFFWSLFIRSATRFLWYSRFAAGNWVTAISALSTRFANQFFILLCRLYFGPFPSSLISLLVNVMFVLFITLG